MEQLIISISCFGSSYYYMFLAAFGAGDQVKQNVLEVVFMFDFFLNFFVEYSPECLDDPPIRDFKIIAHKYWQGDLIKDFIPLIPL